MTSCSTCELGPRFFVSAGMSCIRVSWLPFLRFFVARGRGLPSCRALDNIERLIPFPPAVEYSASTCAGTQATPYLQRPARRNSPGKGPSGAPWCFRAFRSGRSPEGRRGDLFFLVVLGLDLLLLLGYWSHLVSGRDGAGILARLGPFSDRRPEACPFRSGLPC